MNDRWKARALDPIMPLGSSETEPLSQHEEQQLLSELARCKAKLAGALVGIDEPAEGDGKVGARRSGPSPLRSPSEAALGATYRRLIEIRAKLALANMKLVAHVARRFRERGVSYSDLIQEGFHGLLEAIDRYDGSHGTKLATYATWWIRQSIQESVASGAYPVRLSPRHLRQLARSQERTNGSATPSPASRGDGPPVETINKIQVATRPAISLDALIEADSGHRQVEVASRPTPDRMMEMEAGETINRLLDVLRPREREVLAHRFGLGGGEKLSLSQTGTLLKVSKERIRQIQDRALEKLRIAAAEQNLRADLLYSE